MANTGGNDVTVLDALNNYAAIGTFNVMDGGSPVFGDFEQAGIEFDCLGKSLGHQSEHPDGLPGRVR